MEKKADEFADKYGAEYWYTSSRTGEYTSIINYMKLASLVNSQTHSFL